MLGRRPELCTWWVEETEQQGTASMFTEGAETTKTPNLSPRPSRELSGTETNGLIRLFKWIIVFLSFHGDSARLTKGSEGQAWGLGCT